jgi:subtilisin-like proprotein convertase family protein
MSLSVRSRLQRLLVVIAFVIAIFSIFLSTSVQAQEPVDAGSDSSVQTDEAQAEIEKASNPPVRDTSAIRSYPSVAGVNPLFAGVDDVAIPGQTTDPAVGTWTPLFSGIQIWGAAYDYDDDILYITEGTFLSQYIFASGTLTDVASITSSADGAVLSMVSLAYANGTLYGTRNVGSGVNPEGIYSINQTTGVATLTGAFPVPASADLGGFDGDPDTGILYATNDSTPRGLVEVNPNGTFTQVAPYPAGETDIDGLAVGDGKAYLIEDDSIAAGGVVYIYDFDVMTYTGTIDLPWPTSETFSAGAWLAGQSGPTPTPSATITPGGPTATATSTPSNTPTATATATQVPGVPFYAVDLRAAPNVFFRSNTGSPEGALVTISNPANDYYGGDFVNNDFSQLYAINITTNNLVTLNTTTGAETVIGPMVPPAGQTWGGLRWDPSTSTLYAMSNVTGGGTLFTVNPATGATTTVAPFTGLTLLIDIAISPAGQMYGIDISNDSLYSINKATGVATLIGATGIAANFAQGMDFDDSTNTLYWPAYIGAGVNSLATVNTTTGAATAIGSFNNREVDAFAIATSAGGGPTATASPTAGGPTATATASATPQTGNRICSSTVVTIPDSNPTGVTSVINVGTAGTISDLNVVLTGTHSWVGDLRFNISNGTTNVTFYDQPGVPASTFGCSGDNLPGVVGDDEGSSGSFENSCLNATPAYVPGGTYTGNSPLSAFDGATAAGNWTLTVSDLAAGDTGTLDGWCVDITTGAGPTATPTVSPTPQGQVPDINANPSSFTETHSSPPQVTTDTLNIGNTGNATLTWTITEDDSRPFANPNPAQPRDPNAPVARLGAAGGSTTSKLELGPIVGDGSFETGTPNASWEEFSANFGTPLCDAVCGTGGGTGPRTGAWWAWFGGTTAAETGILTQTVTIPSGTAELSFWLEIPPTATGTNGFLSVRMDGTEVFRAEETTPGYGTYAEVTVDATAYADGGTHELVFFSVTDAGAAVTNFFVDDVAITATAGGQCSAPTAIPWLTVSPANGSTAGGGSTPVTLTYNSASLAQGTYTGTLCIASNDPDEALVTVPITLNVGPPTAIDLASFTSPVSGVNLGDMAAAGLLLLAGAVLVLRRK